MAYFKMTQLHKIAARFWDTWPDLPPFGDVGWKYFPAIGEYSQNVTGKCPYLRYLEWITSIRTGGTETLGHGYAFGLIPD